MIENRSGVANPGADPSAGTPPMSYRTPLETRLAKKTTRAITDFNLVEDGDRVMVGLSGGKDSWALIQILDVLRKRAPITFSIVAVNVDSGYEGYQHKAVADACAARGWEFYSEHTNIGAVIEDKLDPEPDAVFAVRAAAPRRALPDGGRGGRHEDCAGAPPRRFRRDAAPEPVLRRRAEGDAGAARLRQQEARRHPSAGLRDRGRGARLRAGIGPADHRLLLPGLRRPRAAASARQAADHGAGTRAPGDQGLDDQGAGQRDAAPPAGSPAEPGRRAPRPAWRPSSRTSPTRRRRCRSFR